ncbi:hypothetical protein MTO96_017111 [Rhipicephalus appendiculatus]
MADEQSALCPAYAHCDSGDAEDFPRHLRVPCTKEEDSDCELLLYLRNSRELLLGASLELVEDERRPGGLRLAVLQAPASPCHLPSTVDERRQKAALVYVEHLLSEHRCITAVEINGSTPQPESLLAALKCNLAVKSVTVRLALDQIDKPNVRVLEVVNELSHLDELEFASVSGNTHWRCEDALLNATYLKGPLMERRTEHLTSLDVSALRLSTEKVRRLVWALIWNHTITELAVPESVFCAYYFDNGELFARYLKKKKATLRKLTLKALGVFKDPENALATLAEAFCGMTTLEELDMDICMDRHGFEKIFAAFAKVVAQNTTLRSLGLLSAVCGSCPRPARGLIGRLLDEEGIEPWLTALRKTSSLQKLKIDCSIFAQEAFEEFLAEVANSDNLRSVVLTAHPADTSLLDLCWALRAYELCSRVRIADHHVQPESVPYISQCAEITRVSVKASHFALNDPWHYEVCGTMESVFSHFEHVTSLRVNCDRFKEQHFAALCAYLSASSALTDVEITLCIRTLDMTAEQSRDVPTRLSSALASNTNLCSVIIKGLQLGNDDLAALADAARKSRRLTEFRYMTQSGSTFDSTFGAVSTETPPSGLDSLACAALVEIQKLTHRNASRVSAAARLVLGESDSTEASMGIELFHDHPYLLELVKDGAHVDTDEAKAMIRKERKKLRMYSVHKFMRTVGVVAWSVECHPRRDGMMQLSDINEDCWSLICSYLSLGDVLETAAAPLWIRPSQPMKTKRTETEGQPNTCRRPPWYLRP